jgi:DNA ligase-1
MNPDFKPFLASDVKLEKITYPVYVQPKIDGVRALIKDGRLLGRSLKWLANVRIQALLGQPEFEGMDGELIAGTEPTAEALCRTTTSLIGSFNKEGEFQYWVFDLTNQPATEGYMARYAALVDLVQATSHLHQGRIKVVPQFLVHNEIELLKMESIFLGENYEGMIGRKPRGLYKNGRSSPTEGALWRLKRFTDSEALVTGMNQGTKNNNAAKINELGHTDRSTHKENIELVERCGSLQATDLKTGKPITVSPGKATEADLEAWWKDPSLVVGHVVKYKSFMVGVKDLPRFPTYQSHRSAVDMSE